MQNRFSALFIGGPPHSGKSTLAHRVSLALSKRGISHYLLRANPDGEGNWFYEANDSIVHDLRCNNKKDWSQSFTDFLIEEIQHAPLPLLVDAGGIPSNESKNIAAACQASVVIAADFNAVSDWLKLVDYAHAVPLAILKSQLSGPQQIWHEEDILRGVITGLHAGGSSDGICFDELVRSIANYFQYSSDEIFEIHRSLAQVDLVVHLEHAAYPLQPHINQNQWQPGELPLLLESLPNNEPMALYGSAPIWVYSALAAYTVQPPLIFTIQRGWLQLHDISQTNIAPQQQTAIQWRIINQSDITILTGRIIHDYLNPDDRDNLTIPVFSHRNGVILAGKLPIWVYAMLARHYRTHAWIAVYQPQLAGAVVVWSQSTAHHVGEVLVVDHAEF